MYVEYPALQYWPVKGNEDRISARSRVTKVAICKLKRTEVDIRKERFISKLPLRLSRMGTRMKSLSTLTKTGHL